MRKLLIIVLALMMVVLAACGSGASGDDDLEVKQMVIASGPIGGSWYNTAAAIAEVLMREMPGLNVTVNEGGGYDNLRLVEKGDAHIGYAFTNDVMTSLEGIDEFEEDGALENVSPFLSLFPSHFQAVVLDKSDIYSFKDLSDKGILPGQSSWTTTAHIEEILDYFGYSYDSVRKNGGSVSNTGYADMPDLIKDGHADVAIGTTAVPAGWIMELNAQDKIRLLNLEPEVREHMVDRFPGLMEMTVPSGSYDGFDEEVETIGAYTNLVFNGDLSEEFVYEITKVIMENIDEIKESDSVLEGFSVETMLTGLDEETVHPGTLKYLEEVK